MKFPANLKNIVITTIIGLCAILLAVMLISMSTGTVDLDNYTSEGIIIKNSTTSQPKQANKTTNNYLEVMTKYGFSEDEAKYMIRTCSNMNNPDWCVKLATSTAWHETKTGTEGVGMPPKNNLHAIKPCGSTSNGTFCYHKSYPNRMASFEDWVVRYNKYWYKNDCFDMIDKSEYTPHNPADWISNCEWMVNKFN